MEKRERSSLSKSHLRKPEAGQIGSLPLTWRLTYELIELEVKIHVRTCQSIPHKKTMNEEDENFSNVTSIDSTSVTCYVTSMLSGRTQHLEQQLNDLPPIGESRNFATYANDGKMQQLTNRKKTQQMTEDLIDSSLASCVMNDFHRAPNGAIVKDLSPSHEDCEGRNPWPWSLPQLFSGGGINPRHPRPSGAGSQLTKVTHVTVEHEKNWTPFCHRLPLLSPT